jgi:deoxyadenosine/deoxycytidine kinase
MKDLGFIEEVEYAVFKEMYKNFSDMLDRQSPWIIYLRCEPEVCFERTKKRCRNE